ncbi:guided entry of tail-anchored proteins factor CAMLG-like [Saccostrea echinata]|uniref:guided entry of tail-anchored proteins factor CAMLG-like n=1 Tax=Saccostrea echinata TaxID=191078 RepID=UPI002A7FE5B2|nr:guided entry of tail-anchored proteins factor CAMLG-like [Saccostrea echinata]
MADTVSRARSEARKKKILENAEKRINRLYSRQTGDQEKDHEGDTENKSAESGEWQCDKCGNINFGSRKACLLCRGKQMTDEKNISDRQHEIDQSMKNIEETAEKSEAGDSQERPLSISRPYQSEVRQRKSPNTVKLQRVDVQREANQVPLPQSTNVQPSWKSTYSQGQLFEMYRILGCILIAFVSRMVLKSGYGLFYFETIFLPFTAFQTGLHLFKNNFLKDVHIYQRQNIMSTALMLCGISPHLIHTYSRIMGYVKAMTEDLFFFLFVFFACGFFI